MRIENDGILLWYETLDAPAPDNIVSVSDRVAITVGIQPVDASNSVEVRYRVNQGKTISIPAQFLKNGRGLTSQYFRASLPAFEPGDTVEYVAICRCAGRQVPSVDELEKFTSSFTVVEAGSQIKRDPPDSSQNQQTSSRESIDTNLKDAQFVHAQETTKKEDNIPSRLSTRKKKHLKNLTEGIAEGKQKEKLKQLFSETEGEFNQLKARLEESEEFDPESIQKLTFKHEMAELLEDEENWIAACAQDNRINCLRDIALNYKKQDFKSLMRSAGIPENAEGEDEEDCLEKCATKVCDRLFRMIPTAVVQRMVQDEEIAIDDPKVREGIFSVLNDHPDLDFRKTSVLEVLQEPDCLKQISEEHQEKVVEGLKNLQRLSVLSPKAEAVPTLLKGNLTSAYAINEVPMERFVSLYGNQLGGEKIARAVHRNAQNITARNEEAYIALRQAVTGAPVRMIHGDSAAINQRTQELIGVVQQKNIPINFETLFGSVDLCECKHCNSVYSPAAYLVELFQYLRNNNLDPYDVQDPTKPNPNTGKLGYSQTPLEMFFRRRPDLGHLQLTCENTNTLIPYVDLVNEVMESFVFNLSKYEDNTFTPKRAIIHTHNVEDESSGELLAEPQHTNYNAYLKLSNTVYPVCQLPYHQPIDATREYLKYLGTSRYELFDTFRTDVPLEVEENATNQERERASHKQELEVLAVERAIAAEFLHLTEEEYIILTKEGFHTKEWYEIEEQTSLTLSQYRQKIGLKNTWDYYGIQTEDQMIEELRWVKPAQDTGIVGFLRRVNIQYTDLIQLLKTRYINPNYLSGKDLAYMNSLRYSYRYLQSLVDKNQTDIKLKYRKLVALLQSKEIKDFNFFIAKNKDFDNDFIECWIYKNFAKIGKLIVLDNGDSSCKCVEGTISLSIFYVKQNPETAISITQMSPEISLNLSRRLILDIDCQIYLNGRNSRQRIGYLETSTGKLVLESLKLFELEPSFLELGEDILRKILQGYLDEDGEQAISYGTFTGKNGEQGIVFSSFLFMNEPLVVCEGSQENCDLSKTQLKHLDGTDLTVPEYDRFHRFIRLWCKLGWTIDEVDQAITGIGETIEKPPFKPLNFSASNPFVALIPSKKELREKPSSQQFNFSDSSSFTEFPPSQPPYKELREKPSSQQFNFSDSSSFTEFPPSQPSKKELREKPSSQQSNFSDSSSFTELPPSQPPYKDGTRNIPQPKKILTARPKPEVNCQPEPISQVLQEITPYLIEQLVAVQKLLDITGLELAKLLTYWTQIGTYGEKSLYSRLFLKYNLTAIENVFKEDDYGTYLSQEECISDHLPILMASLKVDVNMIETIMGLIATPKALNQDDDSQCYLLTLDNVSKVYRHILLAKTLGIRVKELPGLLMLIQDIAHPFGKPTKTLEFYDLFAQIDDSGFSLRELNYVLQDQDDQLRPLRPSMADIFELAIALRDSLLQIEIDHPDIEKDEDATEELLRNKLSLLYESAIVEEIITLLQGSTIYLDNTRRKYSTILNETDQDNINQFLTDKRKEVENAIAELEIAQEKLKTAQEKELENTTKEEQEQVEGLTEKIEELTELIEEFQIFLERVQFSGTKGLQVTGILSESDQNQVIALADYIDDPESKENFLIAAKKIFVQPQQLFDDVLLPIFQENCENHESCEDCKACKNAKNILLAKDLVSAENQENDSGLQKRAFFAKKFLSYLREELRQRQVIQMLASDLGLDIDIIKTLIMEVIKTSTEDPLYQEIIKLKEQKDPAVLDAYWEGVFVPEKEGKYIFFLASSQVANLTFNGRKQAFDLKETDDENINFYESPTFSLKAGQAYPFIIEGYDTDEKGDIIDLFMKFNNQAKVEISDKVLFPAFSTETFRQAYIQLQKAAIVVEGFNMKREEIDFFRDYCQKFKNLNFNKLSFPQWLRLEAFYRLHKSLPQTQLSLIEFFRWTNQTEETETEISLVEQINALTAWEESEIYKMILPQHFNLPNLEDFQDEKNLLKLQTTLQVAEKIGVGMGDLFQWGKPPADFAQSRKITRDIRDTIRARYTQEEWEEAIKQTHDLLRNRQRDALIAYLLAQPVLMEWGVRDADSLFEFFLIDVQMDACMETSRIKQAISSVQLFVQRCFLGLEDKHGVSSDALDRQRWEWMSRYRVWEANRKVFLYPENWIRPELRDVKSPFFEELESELLQNDVSKDTVKSALTKYIVQVDEVANLEVVGQFIEGEGNARKLHVIARTRNAPYFFYYRYYEFDNKYWYPWSKVEVDIPSIDIENDNGEIIQNGSFVLPVVWQDRLFIFFPQFMRKNWSSNLAKEQKISDSADNKMKDSEPICYWEIKMGWSEYKEGKWTSKNLSTEALYSFEYAEAILGNNLSANQTFKFMKNPSKFIFTIYNLPNSLKIQIYYRNPEIILWEYLTSDDTYGVIKQDLTTNSTPVLNQSFKFNGDNISLGTLVSAEIPETFKSSNPIFHYFSELGNNLIYPLQAKKAADNPADIIVPNFKRMSDYSSVNLTNTNTYSFSYSETKILLGHLRKDRLNNIFNSSILLSNNNYGSNDGVKYHELKRPYAIYTWEALFHSVALLADNLSKSQRFEEAMQWWHYIFDPINVKGNIKNVWKFLPFRPVTDSKNVLDQIFSNLEPNAPDNTEEKSIDQWRENPFQPHNIARNRPTAYMKWVVMKYIDNLIAWGDNLFRQDTIESINQATQLYVLAGHILGPRPEIIPERGKKQPQSYLSLLNKWDAFSNAMVDLELVFPFSNQIATEGVFDGEEHYVNIYGFATTLYFCIPDNPKLLEYWDTVADRLFKIRHCLNIEGVFRKLNLFEPPIDPALLVQAAAQGLSISSVLNDLSTPMPNYRFNYLLARALEVTSEVKSLGSALLSALEKKDGESLSILRSQHDTRIQNLIMEVRRKQLEEAKKSLDSLEQNRKSPEYRLQHYLQLIGEEDMTVPAIDAEFTEMENEMPEVEEYGGLKLIPPEAEEIKKAKLSADLQTAVGVLETLASILHLVPDFGTKIQPLGLGGEIVFGGTYLATSLQAVARGLQIGVNRTSFQSSAASRKAGYIRQLQDRIFQLNLSGHELMQIDKQITAQKIRQEIAQLEIENHQIQIEQTEEIEEFIRTKYSNEKLYQWMSDRLKDLYYQAYSFAYDLAKKAEKVYRFEMGLSTSDFIKFGYWDSSKDGFLAGEQLYLALKHLENAYIETKPHDYEITKHISLQQLNPLALIQLKEEGVCEFNFPEEIFDLDYPGDYKRRIKTLSVSVPCVVGPYTSLNCTLRLLKHEYRNSKIAADYPKKLEEADERFIYNPIPTTAIAVSQGQNDSGVFELNFRDERYLPFEGAGTISSWRLELPQEFRQFDYQTITDVVIHLRYTSCEGGTTLKTAAIEHLNEYVKNASELSKREGLFRMFSLRHEFPSEWHRFLNPKPETESQILILGNLRERLPFFANSQKVNNVTIQSIMFFVPPIDNELTVSLFRFDQAENVDIENIEPTITLGVGANISQLKQYTATDQEQDINGFWALVVNEAEFITADVLSDAWLVIKYVVEF